MKSHNTIARWVLLLGVQSSLFALSGCRPSVPHSGPVSCERWVDSQGIVHLRSSEDLSVIQCLGREHAISRPFQMAFFRRTTLGERSALFGPSELRVDFMMRLLDLRAQARRIASELPTQTREWLEVYARGANQGFAEVKAGKVKDDPLLKTSGESLDFVWSTEDTLSLILLQSFDQTRKTFETEFKEAKFAQFHGEDAAKRWFNLSGLPWENTILKPGEYTPRVGPSEPSSEHPAPVRPQPHAPKEAQYWAWPEFQKAQRETGSNNWALSGTRTQSGKVWVANDPHLSLTHPPFWHWVHVQGSRLNAIGVAFPGIPLIVSGANLNMSWGLTNSFINTADAPLVSQKELSSKAQREFPVIWVKLGPLKLPIFFKALYRTPSGQPILPIPASSPEYRHVLRWSAFSLQGADFQSFFEMMYAEDSTQMDDLASRMGVPSWNLVFGDREGGIGFRVLGKIPRVKSTIPPGHSVLSLKEAEEPMEYLGIDEIPHALNPNRGYLLTANHRHWEDSLSAFQGGQGYAFGFRGYRLEELLLADKKQSLATQKQIQCDTQVVDARFFVPLLLSEVIRPARLAQKGAEDSRVAAAVELLTEWRSLEYQANADCRACGPYRRWMERIFEREGIDERALYRWLTEDAARVLTPERIAVWLKDLNTALEDLGIKEGSLKESFPAWGDLHQNAFRSIAAPHLPAGRAPGVPTPGDDHSLSPGTSDWDSTSAKYQQVAGASHRLLVHMTSPPEVYGILPDTGSDAILKTYLTCGLERRQFPVDWESETVRATKEVLSF